jgi:hypothetical protein
MKRCHSLVLAAGLVLAVTGCQSSEEGVPTDDRPKVVFEGKPDERFVAVWNSKETAGNAYTIKGDGTYSYKGVVFMQGKKIDNQFEGEWLVNGDRLLFKDKNGNVVPYAYKFEGDTLTLSLTGRLKRDTVLIKAPN